MPTPQVRPVVPPEKRCCWPNCRNERGDELLDKVAPGFALCVIHGFVAYTAMRQTRGFNADGVLTPQGRRLPPENVNDGWIYYLRIGDHIKIGYAKNLYNRLMQYPPNSELLASHPGTRDDERDLHAMFQTYRSHGREWYTPAPMILRHIDTMIERHGRPAAPDRRARTGQHVAMRSRSGGSYARKA